MLTAMVAPARSSGCRVPPRAASARDLMRSAIARIPRSCALLSTGTTKPRSVSAARPTLTSERMTMWSPPQPAFNRGCSATVRHRAATVTGRGETLSSVRNSSRLVQSRVRKVVTCGIAVCFSRLVAMARRTGVSSTLRVPGAAALDPAAARTSSSVILPPGPAPLSDVRSTPSSLASLRTGGVALTSRTAAPAVPVSSISKVTSGAPTGTLSSCSPCSVAIRPANGEGTSTTALAVSISTSGWFSATRSPGETSHATIVPSSRPSPRSGSEKTRSISRTRPS